MSAKVGEQTAEQRARQYVTEWHSCSIYEFVQRVIEDTEAATGARACEIAKAHIGKREWATDYDREETLGDFGYAQACQEIADAIRCEFEEAK